MALDTKEYYKILEIPAGTEDQEVIKKAYRKKAMQYHPDRNKEKEAENTFKKINEAYEVLSNKEKKEAYDRGLDQRRFGPDHNNFDPDINEIVREFMQNQNDFRSNFGSFRGFNRGQNQSHRREIRVNPDIKLGMRISLENAFVGGKADIEFNRIIACSDCKSHGSIGNGKKCKNCEGSGVVTSESGFMIIQQTCPYCRGEGKIYDNCKTCDGERFKQEKKQVTVTIPSGILNMTSLKLSGIGNEIYRNGNKTTGDVYVVIEYPTSQNGITIDKGNIYATVKVPFSTLFIEKSINVNIFNVKNIKLDLNTNNPSGHEYIIKKEGINNNHDAFIKVFLDIPKKNISEKESNKLKKVIGDIYGKCETSFEPSSI